MDAFTLRAVAKLIRQRLQLAAVRAGAGVTDLRWLAAERSMRQLAQDLELTAEAFEETHEESVAS